MVVKHEKSVEEIRERLSNLHRFFLTDQAQDTDRKLLVSIECDLIKMESELRTYSGYRGNPERSGVAK
jgi:hypothetical protein